MMQENRGPTACESAILDHALDQDEQRLVTGARRYEVQVDHGGQALSRTAQARVMIESRHTEGRAASLLQFEREDRRNHDPPSDLSSA